VNADNAAMNPDLVVFENTLFAAWCEELVSTTVIRVASLHATPADASKNAVNASPSTVTVGSTVTLTATGDRQAAAGVLEGDERYVPQSWSSSEEEKSGDFTFIEDNFTSAYTPSATGSHTVTVTFAKETWVDNDWVNTDSVTKETLVTVNAAATQADASKNSVSASPSTVKAGGSVTLTATGDRQAAAGVTEGDERYIPTSWSSEESGKAGTFTLSGGSYISTYSPSVKGSHKVKVTFTKQIFDIEDEWVDADQEDTKTATVTVSSGSSSGGNPSTGPSTGPSTPPSTNDNAVIVLVNGKPENAGTATTGKRNEQTVTTIHVDEKKLNDKLAAEGHGAVVTIPVNAKTDIVIGELNGQMIKNMEDKQAVLEIRTDTATYTIPEQQINIDAISAQVGQSVALQDIKVQIEIAATPPDMVKVVENAAVQGTFSIVVPSLDFKVSATYGNTTIEVSKFNVYVERTVAIPDDIDPNKITTGVVVEPDGTVRHVPTKVTQIDGKYYAVINSLTNSTYSVVWHPIEFSDVAEHWAKNAVNDMGSRMVIDGTGNGTFSPDRDITRAEFAAIIVRGLGLRLENGAVPFSDVKAADWYGSAVSTAYAYDLIKGFEDGTFRPMDKITREEAMMILSKAMAITGLKARSAVQSEEAALRPFEDTAEISNWAVSSVTENVRAGIVIGRSEIELAPKDYMSRAEVATIIQRLLQKSNLI